MAQQEDWHAQPANRVLAGMESSKDGLSVAQATARKKKHGPNELARAPLPGWWSILLRQFANPLIFILVIAAAVSLFLREYFDAAVIAAAVFVNTFVGFVQEYKANRSLAALRSYAVPKALVRRAGGEREIPAADVVPGDILLLRAGDLVAADARILAATALSTDEAALTGESSAVSKQAAAVKSGTLLAERVCMVYAGTSVASGVGEAVVVATGAASELGGIARMVGEEREAVTPLQKEFTTFARRIGIGATVIVAVIFFLGVSRGEEAFEMLKTSIALAVAAVPEGLVVAITIVLAIGAQRMYRRKSLIRRLVAAETLGSVSIICTDKTGTITEGEMRVAEVVPWSGPVEAAEISHVESAEEIVLALEIAMLCNDASVAEGGGLEKTKVIGSSTERALMEGGLQAGIAIGPLRTRHKRIDEIPFDAEKKYMATLNAWEGGNRILVKGAPERVLDFCAKMHDGDKEHALGAKERDALARQGLEMAERGLRVLAVAYRPAKDAKAITEKDLHGCIFAGFIGLRDPLRPEAKESIEETRKAGIRTVIITGDHPSTAAAIAKEAGIRVADGGLVLGSDVDGWSDKELGKRIATVEVYARAEPKHKIRIIKAFQAKGEVVAMTGDGVNDAPALAAADIGIALGSGTEVAKEAADMVLLDNNLSTIEAAVEEGRVIYDNIRKTTVYLLLSSFTEIILISGAILLGLPMPLLAVQILWINLVQDTFPAIALTREPAEPDIMRLPPRRRGGSMLDREMLAYVFGVGVLTNLLLLPIYIWLLRSTGDEVLVRTVMFAAVGLNALLYVFGIRSFRRSIFRINPFSNPWLLVSLAFSFGLMLLALLHPFFQKAFGLVPIGLSEWTLLLMMGAMTLIAVELFKYWRNHRKSSI